MRKANPRAAITAIHDDISFSKRDVYLWVKLAPKHYEFKEQEKRERYAEEFSIALANILNSEENELEAHLIVTSKTFDTVQWRNNYLEKSRHNSPPAYFNEFTAQMANQIYSYEFRDKNVYLGINLGERREFSDKKNTFKVPFFDALITQLTGEVDEYITEKEILFWQEKARLIRFSLTEGPLEAQPVNSNEIAYVIRKNFFPAMPSPTIDDLSITEKQEWGAGELITLTDADIVNKPKWLEITQIVNGEPVTGYRATLCIAKFPEVLYYPEKEPWIHSVSLLGFPVDIHSRFSIIPSKKVQKQVTNKIKDIKDQAANITSSGGELTLEVQENYRLGQYLEYALSKDDTPWLFGRHRIVVEAVTLDELKERCQAVIDHYKAMGILVVWSTGDQLDLLLETLPNDYVRLSSYYQRHELSIIGAGVPTGSGGTGDLPMPDASGTVRGWLGPYIGYTTSRVVEPVFLSMQSAISRSFPPGLVITGSPGSGKSFTAFTLTYNMVLSGVQTVYIDPKNDALPLKTLPGCENATIVNLNDSHDGMLDPFQIGQDESEKIDLVNETISMFVGGVKNLSSVAQAELSRTIKVVLRERYPSMNKLTEILLASARPDAAALGERLSMIRKLPYARLCFSTVNKNNPIESLQLNPNLTIITLLGLDMPSSLTPKEDYSSRNQLAVAILFLLTSFTKKIMMGSGEKTYRPKAIVIDEAWAITATAQGAKMVLEVARMGRSLNTAIVLVSQNAGDFLGESITNSVSTRMCFKAQEEKEAENVLHFLNLPITQPNIEVVLNLRQGECLLKDGDRRIARVKIDSWNAQMSQAFETNPIAKRENAAQNTPVQ